MKQSIDIIDTGYFFADGGAMFGAVPKTSWSRRYPSDEKNGCVLAMRSLLITTENRHIILTDTGAGSKHLQQLKYYRFFDLKDLNEELEKRGIRAGDVTDVILTHLHFDHCGYVTQRVESSGQYTVSFPNARHWVSRSQWENFLRPNALEKDSYFPENMAAAEEAGLLHLIEEETELCPDVSLRLYDGHTVGQIVPYIRMPERIFVFAGDVIPLAASLSPAWISAYDTHPVTSYSEKIRLLEEAVRENQAVIYCHDAYTRCTTVKGRQGIFKATDIINVNS
ncbi:beta-lactamase family protein [Bacteroidales bacterium Barb6]|nr:beta-lactamase family protein [Bacteroidales bacterium Barb6]